MLRNFYSRIRRNYRDPIDMQTVLVNTFHMNSISPVLHKVRTLIASKLSPYFRQPPVIRRSIAIQLEFPWLSKR